MTSCWNSNSDTATFRNSDIPSFEIQTGDLDNPPYRALQIPMYITHRNLAVCKIMEVMHTTCTKKDLVTTHLKQNMTQTITQVHVCERKACIVCKEHFVLLDCLMNLVVKVLLKYNIHFSISFRWYTFPNFCMQISHPLAYCISSKPAWPLITPPQYQGFAKLIHY